MKGGRAALFMGAITAARHNPALKAFRRLIDAGKPKLVAVARKLLTTLNAIVRAGTPWRPGQIQP